MTETIRPGNSHEFTTRIVDDDRQPWPLADSTVIETIKNIRGTTVLTHTLVVDAIGTATISDGIELAGDAADGTITRHLTQAETADLADGWYRYTLDLIDTNDNQWTVETGAWKIESEVTFQVRSGVTRREIRRRTFSKLGDLIIVKATANGSMSTLVDTVHLTGEPDAYRGRQLLMTGGTVANIGEQRYVTGSQRSNRSLTVDYDLPANTVIGDEGELVNTFGTGYRIDDVELAIDAAIESAADMAPEPVVLDIADAYDKDLGTLTVPDDWIAVSAVDWRDDSDQPWQALEYSQRRLSSGWGLDRSRRHILLSGERSLWIHTKSVRIYGLRRPGPIPNDDDVTGINAEWLVARCVAELSSAAFRRNPTAEKRDMLAYDLENERMIRTRVTKRSGAGAQRL